MTTLEGLSDLLEIQALSTEFTDASMMHDWDRFASLFAEDGAWRMPHIEVELTTRDDIRAGVERLREGLWEYFVQNAHPGPIRIDGDTAQGRAYIEEFGKFRDGGFLHNHAIYHDQYRRTPDGWRFADRLYEIRYLDTDPLPGGPPEANGQAVSDQVDGTE